MSVKVEKFMKYQPNRDTIIVLGAGASRPDGVPLQKDILPQIITGEIIEIQNSEIGKIVIEFLQDNFSFDCKKKLYPTLEAVFGFLDYFIQHNESLNAKYSCERISHIKELLIKLIHYIVNLATDKSSEYYNLFWKTIIHNAPNSSILTLNYDTLLEQSFEFLFKNHSYIDYCIPLMNYSDDSKLKTFNFWVNPREPVLVDADENPIPIKIIKLHGSLNWKYCNCCNQVLLTPWDRKIDLARDKFLGYTYPEKEEYEFLCPLDGTEFQTLIMPPSHIKTLNHPIITQLFNEAAREIRIAKKIVFIGYSLSDADVHIKALFKKLMRPNTEIFVVNPKKKDSMELNYRSLSDNVRFLYTSFENFLESSEVIEEVFTPNCN
jgi:hypothetical protein